MNKFKEQIEKLKTYTEDPKNWLYSDEPILDPNMCLDFKINGDEIRLLYTIEIIEYKPMHHLSFGRKDKEPFDDKQTLIDLWVIVCMILGFETKVTDTNRLVKNNIIHIWKEGL